MSAAPARPPAISQLIAEWVDHDRPGQDPITWDRSRWLAPPGEKPKYPSVVAFDRLLKALPNPIGRDHVRCHARRAGDSPAAATEAFVASMVWGFGRTGYAVFRTNRILDASPDAGERLHHIAKVLTDEGPVKGYRAMANEHRLKWLGPAFGTKYLHFCSAPDDPALVLDVLVATWLNEYCGTRLRPTRWSTAQYEHYLENMTAWSDGLCTPTELETLVFVAEASRRTGNQWAPQRAKTP